MINRDEAADSQDAEVDRIVQSGARGAVMLAGFSTAIVLALWFVFYIAVFSPRVATP